MGLGWDVKEGLSEKVTQILDYAEHKEGRPRNVFVFGQQIL